MTIEDRNLADLRKHLDRFMHEQNTRGIQDFDGYSPHEMHQILHYTFSGDSPLVLHTLSDEDCQQVPIFNQVRYLGERIAEGGEIKLTNNGFLPVRLVADLYAQGFIKDDFIESGISKLYKETDSMSINLAHILIKISGLVKTRHGKLSLTKNGEKTIVYSNKLLHLIFTTFTTKFNWAYYDGYGENNIGQLGFGFSLILLKKYGDIRRLDQFYAEKYFRAFPMLITDETQERYRSPEDRSASCYSLRTFDRFLNYFGLIRIESVKKYDSPKYITKTDLFDRFIGVEE